MKKYYIYEHRTLDGDVFYIGKGTFNKKYSYGGYQRAYSKQNRSNKWKNIASKGYSVSIIFESDDLNFILQKENELWENCPLCVNKQVTKSFKDYSLYKISDDLYTLHIFGSVYLVFRSGELLNSKGKKLIPSDNGKGYKIITFTNGETIRKNMYVHRMIAECFIENPNNLSVVNHKDLNKSNNCADNLEWVTQQENVIHSLNLSPYRFKDKIKPIYQFTKDGLLMKEWDRCSSVAEYYKCTEELIQQACQQKNIKKGLTAKGFIWIYKEDFLKGNSKKLQLIKEKYART
jgi:hypothetical protein